MLKRRTIRRGEYGMADDTTASIRRINPPALGSPPGYSQVVEVRAGRLVFIAGQTSLDRDGQLVGRGDFAAQAAQVFRNLGAALEVCRLRRKQSGQADGLSAGYGQSASLSRGAKSILRHRVAARGSGSDVGRSVEAVRPGIHDRNRGHSGCIAQRMPAMGGALLDCAASTPSKSGAEPRARRIGLSVR